MTFYQRFNFILMVLKHQNRDFWILTFENDFYTQNGETYFLSKNPNPNFCSTWLRFWSTTKHIFWYHSRWTWRWEPDFLMKKRIFEGGKSRFPKIWLGFRVQDLPIMIGPGLSRKVHLFYTFAKNILKMFLLLLETSFIYYYPLQKFRVSPLE